MWTKCPVKRFSRSKIRPVSCERGLSGRLQEVIPLRERNHRGSLPRRCPNTSTLWKIIYCLCAVPCGYLSSSCTLSSMVHHAANIEIRLCVKWSLRKVKNNGKLINRQSRKVVVVVAYSAWSFSRGSNFNALTGKILVFWISLSLMGDGRLERWSHIGVGQYFHLPSEISLF